MGSFLLDIFVKVLIKNENKDGLQLGVLFQLSR